MSNWVSHISPDGRPYWFNSIDNVSVWEKPEELKTTQEKELGLLQWKEYQTGGRKYWVHSQTKETTWDCPKEVLAILNKSIPLIPTGPTMDKIPTGPKGYSPEPTQKLSHPSLPLTPSSGALVPGGGYGQIRPNFAPIQQPQIISTEFMTLKDAEVAFMNMLTEIGVDEKWNWEQVMRETITLPMYKVYKTSAERKATFEKFVQQLIAQEKETMLASVERARKAWNSAMDKLRGGTDNEGTVKVWWNWEMRKEGLQKRLPEDIWESLRNDEERKALFEDYLSTLKKRQATKAEELRTKNIAKLTTVLQTLSLDLASTVGWKDAQEVIATTKEWQTDTELQQIDPLDVLAIFEEEVRRADKEMSDLKQRTSFEKRRMERKAREAFIALLNSLIATDEITYRSTWKSVYPQLESTEAYQNLLGTSGSSPLDLFWDVTDSLEIRIENDLILVEKIVKGKVADFKEEMSYEEMVNLLEGDDRLAEVDYSTIKSVYDRLHDRAVRNKKDDNRRAEKKQRILIDDLRYELKKLDPPIELDSTFEQVVPRIEKIEEFIALNDSARRTAFEKFIKRQKEKLKEREEVSEDDSIHSGTGGPKRKDSSARIDRFEGEIKKRRESEVGGKDENKMELDNVKTAEPHLREEGGELEEGEI